MHVVYCLYTCTVCTFSCLITVHNVCVPLTEDPSPGLHVEVGEDVGPTRRGLPHRAGDGGDRTGDHGQPAERQRDRRQNEGQGESVVQINWPRPLGAPGHCSLV